MFANLWWKFEISLLLRFVLFQLSEVDLHQVCREEKTSGKNVFFSVFYRFFSQGWKTRKITENYSTFKTSFLGIFSYFSWQKVGKKFRERKNFRSKMFDTENTQFSLFWCEKNCILCSNHINDGLWCQKIDEKSENFVKIVSFSSIIFFLFYGKIRKKRKTTGKKRFFSGK